MVGPDKKDRRKVKPQTAKEKKAKLTQKVLSLLSPTPPPPKQEQEDESAY